MALFSVSSVSAAEVSSNLLSILESFRSTGFLQSIPHHRPVRRELEIDRLRLGIGLEVCQCLLEGVLVERIEVEGIHVVKRSGK